MTANPVFTQALADACGRPVEVAPILEATTLGAAFLAGMATGTWADEDDVAAAWIPRVEVLPTRSDTERTAARAQRTVPRPGPTTAPGDGALWSRRVAPYTGSSVQPRHRRRPHRPRPGKQETP